MTVAGICRITCDVNVLLEVRGVKIEILMMTLMLLVLLIRMVKLIMMNANDCNFSGETEEGGELLEQDEQGERLFLRAPRVVRR